MTLLSTYIATPHLEGVRDFTKAVNNAMWLAFHDKTCKSTVLLM